MQHNDHTKYALLLGDMTHSGVVDTLAANGLQYIHKILHSSVENWMSIVDHLESGAISMVLAKFSPKTYSYIGDEDYAQVCMDLFARIARIPHVVYVFEDLLAGTGLHDEIPTAEEIMERCFIDDENSIHAKVVIEAYQADPESYYTLYHRHYVPTGLWQEANAKITGSGLTILPYRTRVEVSISATAFIEEIGQGLLFRLYIPSGMLWEAEVGKLISLFRDYLAKVGRISVRLDQTRTNHGVICTFYTHDILQSGDLSSEFGEFSALLDLCATDPNAAEAILKQKDLDSGEIVQIISRYSREARRLQIDMKHERETKLLAIRQRMESELVDALPHSVDGQILTSIADSVLPELRGIVSSVSPYVHRSLPAEQLPAPVTINISPQFIEKMDGIVAQEIYGEINLGAQDRELLELFGAYAEDTQQLTSSLHELNDDSAPSAGRVAAKQRIAKFLIGVRSRIGDMAFGLLQTYIAKKLLGT